MYCVLVVVVKRSFFRKLPRTFLLAGGYDSGYLDAVYEFDVDSWNWILREEALQAARQHFVAIRMP